MRESKAMKTVIRDSQDGVIMVYVGKANGTVIRNIERRQNFRELQVA